MQEESWFLSAFHQAPAALALLDVDGSILHSNVALQQLLGCPETDLCGLALAALVEPADAPSFAPGVLRRRAHEVQRVETRVRRKDGTVLWSRISLSPIRDAADAPTALVALVEDLTTQKEAQAAVRQRDEFLATIAHDLKTPLEDRVALQLQVHADRPHQVRLVIYHQNSTWGGVARHSTLLAILAPRLPHACWNCARIGGPRRGARILKNAKAEWVAAEDEGREEGDYSRPLCAAVPASRISSRPASAFRRARTPSGRVARCLPWPSGKL